MKIWWTINLEKYDEEISNIQLKACQCLSKTNADRLDGINLTKKTKKTWTTAWKIMANETKYWIS